MVIKLSLKGYMIYSKLLYIARTSLSEIVNYPYTGYAFCAHLFDNLFNLKF